MNETQQCTAASEAAFYALPPGWVAPSVKHDWGPWAEVPGLPGILVAPCIRCGVTVARGEVSTYE